MPEATKKPRALRNFIDRKAMMQGALKNSEACFHALSDAFPLGVFVSDSQGGCVYTNAAYQKISGLMYEQALGMNWCRAIHPEDRQRVLTEWRRATTDQAPFQTEFRFQRENGSVVWTRVNSAAMRDGANLQGYVQTVEDITERKSAEFRLRKAEEALFLEKERAQITLNSIGDAVVTTDLQGSVSYLNPVAETLTGWSCEDALGRPLVDVFKIIDSTTRRATADPARRAIEQNNAVGLGADCTRLLHKSGVYGVNC